MSETMFIASISFTVHREKLLMRLLCNCGEEEREECMNEALGTNVSWVHSTIGCSVQNHQKDTCIYMYHMKG